jgi:hypothetical protein
MRHFHELLRDRRGARNNAAMGKAIARRAPDREPVDTRVIEKALSSAASIAWIRCSGTSASFTGRAKPSLCVSRAVARRCDR